MWMDRISGIYHADVLGLGGAAPPPESHPNCLAQVKHYRSLVPMAQEARKPVFDLEPADGAFGGHQAAVRGSRADFVALAGVIAERVGITLPARAA